MADEENGKPSEKRSAQRTQEAPSKPERVRYIVGLMAAGQWVTGVTVVELAEKWGISEGTARDDAAEASRRIRDAVNDTDELRGQILATLQTITERAMHKGQLRTAVESVKALAGISGVEAAKKVDVGGSLAEFLALGHTPGGKEPGPKVDE